MNREPISLEQVQKEAEASLRRSQERRSAPDPRLLPRGKTEMAVTFAVAALLAVAMIVFVTVFMAAGGTTP